MITYQPKDGRIQRKIRIENSKGDTAAHLWNRQRERDQQARDKRQGEAPSAQPDKKQREGGPWPNKQWSGGKWWQQSSGSGSSSSWNKRR